METGISICLIVKNEERMLPGCLESAATAANEVVIVDTGSTDGTKKVAARFGARVSDYDFTLADFAAARNQSIAAATKPWILILDADERLAPGSGAILHALTRVEESIAYVVKRLNHGLPGANVMTDYAVRLFRNLPSHRYRGRVHETIDASILESGGRIQTSPLTLHHVAQASDNGEAKSRFYLGILHEELRQDPNNVDRLTFLCAELHKLGRLDEATETAERIARLAPKDPTSFVNVGLYRLMHGNDRVGAENAFRTALALQPSHEKAAACLQLLLRDGT